MFMRAFPGSEVETDTHIGVALEYINTCLFRVRGFMTSIDRDE